MKTFLPPSASQLAVRKAVIRIVPLLMVMYIFSYLDRVNVSFAALSMNADLGLTATAYGIGAALFFAGYVLLEVPSNLILHKVGARLWIARIMVTWGLLAAAMSLVQDEAGFYLVRILLGIAEAGFVPGIILYITFWFPREIRGRIVALFLMAIPLSVVLGAPLSAWLIDTGHGLLGLSGWRWMFIAEGLPCVLLGILVLFALPETPDKVSWLTGDEKAALNRELSQELEEASRHGLATAMHALKDWRVYAVAALGFSANIGGYALSFFLPQVINGLATRFGTKFNLFDTALLTAIPYACAAIALWFNGRHSDKTGERMMHIALPLLTGAVSVAVALFLPSTAAVLVAISIAAAGSYAIIPIFWQLPPRFLTGAAAAAGIGVVGALANVAGFVAPYVTGALKDATGDFKAGMFVVAGVMVGGAILALFMGRRQEFKAHPPTSEASTRHSPKLAVSRPSLTQNVNHQSADRDDHA